MKYIKAFFTNIGLTYGRTSRRDYFMTIIYLFLFNVIVGMLSGLIARLLIIPSLFVTLVVIFNSLTMLATFTIKIRRLHDTNRSGLNLLWNIIPVFGQILLFIFLFSPGDPFENRYGFPENI